MLEGRPVQNGKALEDRAETLVFAAQRKELLRIG